MKHKIQQQKDRELSEPHGQEAGSSPVSTLTRLSQDAPGSYGTADGGYS